MNIKIEYCMPCDYSDYALMAVSELIKNYQQNIKSLTLITVSKGIFDIKVNDEIIFSKKELNRFPKEGELINLLTDKIIS